MGFLEKVIASQEDKIKFEKTKLSKEENKLALLSSLKELGKEGCLRRLIELHVLYLKDIQLTENNQQINFSEEEALLRELFNPHKDFQSCRAALKSLMTDLLEVLKGEKENAPFVFLETRLAHEEREELRERAEAGEFCSQLDFSMTSSLSPSQGLLDKRLNELDLDIKALDLGLKNIPRYPTHGSLSLGFPFHQGESYPVDPSRVLTQSPRAKQWEDTVALFAQVDGFNSRAPSAEVLPRDEEDEEEGLRISPYIW